MKVFGPPLCPPPRRAQTRMPLMRIAHGCYDDAAELSSFKRAYLMKISSLRDLPRLVLAVLFIAIMIVASLWIMQPFLPALIWSTLVVVSTWPVMRAVQRRLWGKRSLA